MAICFAVGRVPPLGPLGPLGKDGVDESRRESARIWLTLLVMLVVAPAIVDDGREEETVAALLPAVVLVMIDYLVLVETVLKIVTRL